MATALSAFVPRIAYRVDGCPDITIEQAALDACVEFCERSMILRQTLDAVTTTALEPEVELDIPSGYRLVQIVKVWVDKAEIEAASEESVSSPLVHVDSITGQSSPSGQPVQFVETEPGTIRLYPQPDKAYTITVRAALKPSRSATTVDDILYENWLDAITDGALGRLYAMPERWGNTGLAKYHLQNFSARSGDALAEASRGRARSDMRIKPVWI